MFRVRYFSLFSGHSGRCLEVFDDSLGKQALTGTPGSPTLGESATPPNPRGVGGRSSRRMFLTETFSTTPVRETCRRALIARASAPSSHIGGFASQARCMFWRDRSPAWEQV